MAGVAVLAILFPFARGDGTDWVNPRYLASQAALTPSTTAARKAYLSRASVVSRGGPWSTYPDAMRTPRIQVTIHTAAIGRIATGAARVIRTAAGGWRRKLRRSVKPQKNPD